MEETKNLRIILSLIFGILLTLLFSDYAFLSMGFSEPITLLLGILISWLIITFFTWVGDGTIREP